MSQQLDWLVGIDENTAGATATAAVNTATQAAPGVGKQLFITGFSFSNSGTAPAAGTHTVSVRHSTGGTIVKSVLVPVGNTRPIIHEFKRPIRVPENQNADITVGSLGAGAVSRVELWTITRPVAGQTIPQN